MSKMRIYRKISTQETSLLSMLSKCRRTINRMRKYTVTKALGARMYWDKV